MKPYRTLVSVTSLFASGSLALACGGADSPPPQEPAPAAPAVTAYPSPPAPAPPPPEPPKLIADAAVTALEGIFAALSAHDPQKAASFYTDDVTFHAAGLPERKGKAAFIAELTDDLSAAPDAKYTVDRILVKDDVGIVQWTFLGTNTGALTAGKKPTGKPIGFQGVTVERFTAEGKVKEQHNYFDAGTLLKQVGILKGTTRPLPTPRATPEILVSKGTPAEEAQVARVRQADELYDAKDLDGFLALWNDDAIADTVSEPAAVVGKPALRKQYALVFKFAPKTKLTASGIWSAGAVVVQEYAITVGDAADAPTFHLVDVIDVANGKAARDTSYDNSLENAPPPAAKTKPKAPAAAAARAK
jgi:ketosteroid isomerase-like protein